VKRASPPKAGGDAFRVRFVGKDDAPLSMPEMQQGLLELARKLREHGNVRVKRGTLYLTLIDEDGKEILLDRKGEWEIRPYKSAAEQFGL
jgi:hypothetical protein